MRKRKKKTHPADCILQSFKEDSSSSISPRDEITLCHTLGFGTKWLAGYVPPSLSLWQGKMFASDLKLVSFCSSAFHLLFGERSDVHEQIKFANERRVMSRGCSV
jgi:hypothetical protein